MKLSLPTPAFDELHRRLAHARKRQDLVRVPKDALDQILRDYSALIGACVSHGIKIQDCDGSALSR